jgi:hypothetical protein
MDAGLIEMEGRAKRYVHSQRLLKEEPSDFGRLRQVRQEFERRRMAWR